jgi:hypothetical protein
VLKLARKDSATLPRRRRSAACRSPEGAMPSAQLMVLSAVALLAGVVDAASQLFVL